MKRRVDRTCTRIQVESTVWKLTHHVVFGWCLRAVVRGVLVSRNQTKKFVHVQRCEIRQLGGTQVASRTFDPQNVRFLAGKRIDFHDLRGRVSASGIGNPLIRAKAIGSVSQSFGRR